MGRLVPLKRFNRKRRSSARRDTAIVFDGDDTLWLTQRHYDETIQLFISFLSAQGFPRAITRQVFDRIDLANVSKHGFSRERFPRSMVETYRDLLKQRGGKYERAVAARVRMIGRDVFASLPELRPGVRTVLRDLRRGHMLVLLTAGDRLVQRAKIRRLGMARYFDRVVITPLKNAKVMRKVVDDLGIPPCCAMMVGNSLRSDILPAREAGLTAVQILARGWHYDRSVRSTGHLRIRNLQRVPEIARKVLGPNYVG
ncbi:MAG: HAD family hydrolase [Opitutus sp.]|nr:HAD family hydrolase [Opitutus sp.]